MPILAEPPHKLQGPLRVVISRFIPLGLAALLAGCAAAVPGYMPTADVKPPSFESGRMEGGKYVLSASERGLDCKQMTGSMLITIARLKDRMLRAKPSDLSTTVKNTVAPLYGGTTVNSDPDGEIAREKAKLYAYNDNLGEKGCKTLDVDGELAKPIDGPHRY